MPYPAARQGLRRPRPPADWVVQLTVSTHIQEQYVAFSTEEEETLDSLKRWWNESGKSLALGVVIFAVGYLGWSQWQAMQTTNTAEASDLFEELGTTVVLGPGVPVTEDARSRAQTLIQQLKADYADTTYALYGALFGARLAVDQNDLPTAEAELQWLLDNTRSGLFGATNPSLIITAQLRLARVILARGDAERALVLLDSITPGAFEADHAEIRGDVLVALGRTSEAQASFQAALQAGSTSTTLQMKLDDLALGS
jgi:predicted negative regulator of RcsB-dependent stress response